MKSYLSEKTIGLDKIGPFYFFGVPVCVAFYLILAIKSCGPHACFINDKYPRAINPDGNIKGPDDWEITEMLIKKGVGIGGNATILCGIEIGEFAMIGAGTAVTKDVPPHAVVTGNPAKIIKYNE
jgi:acetyltransferase-like isoleucine patch superfamily enzyme